MLNSKLTMLSALTSFLVMLAVGANAQTLATPSGSELNYTSTYCLPTQNILNFSGLNIFGGAADIVHQSNGATVKWTVWAGTTFDDPNPIREFVSQGPTVSGLIRFDTSHPSNVWYQACISNTIPPSSGGTGNTAVFALQQNPQ